MKSIKKLILSFGYALQGFVFCIKSCRNFRIHTVAAALVLWVTHFYDFNKTDYAVIILTIGTVISFEAMNTALEEACQTEISERVKHAKDSAAAAVLCSAIFSVIIAVFMFFDINAFLKIVDYFKYTPINLLYFAIATVIALVYIFYEDIFKHGK